MVANAKFKQSTKLLINSLSFRTMLNTNHYRFTKSVEKFCDGTTLHGFKELYSATSIWVKIAWTSFIITALGIAMYQVYQVLDNFHDHPTTTAIQPLEVTPKYVPVQICYFHWIYWVDWEKAISLGFTKESVLYGMSLMTAVFSSTRFDVEDTKLYFHKTMELNNFQNVSQFYFAIAQDQPPGFTFILGLDTFTKKFHEYWTNEMCYLAVPSVVISESNSQPLVTMGYNGNYSRSNGYINSAEYMQYMFAYLNSQIKSVDLAAHILPPAIAVDGRFEDMFVQLNIYVYLIKVQISVQKWQNTDKTPCRENTHQLIPKTDCWQMCQIRNEIRKTFGCITFQQAVTLQNESFAQICQKEIIFFSENDTNLPVVVNDPMNVAGISGVKNVTGQYQENCAQICLPSCEQWRFDYCIETKTFLSENLNNRLTYVKINYPSPSSILVMSEIDSQTWGTIIGNIGGLMGLWLGASVISLVQMICLCFCHHHHGEQQRITINADLKQKDPVISVTNDKKQATSWNF